MPVGVLRDIDLCASLAAVPAECWRWEIVRRCSSNSKDTTTPPCNDHTTYDHIHQEGSPHPQVHHCYVHVLGNHRRTVNKNARARCDCPRRAHVPLTVSPRHGHGHLEIAVGQLTTVATCARQQQPVHGDHMRTAGPRIGSLCSKCS